MDDAQLRTVWQQRQFNDRAVPRNKPLALLMKSTLGRRVRQLGRLAEIWVEMIRPLRDGGLMREIQRRFSGALNKVRLTPGQFARTDSLGNPRYEF